MRKPLTLKFTWLLPWKGIQSGERQEDIDKAKSDLKSAKKLVEGDGISCEEHLLIRGMDPGEDLVEFAEEKEANAIFVGVLKTSKVAKLLLGSNAQYVILQATCPVITVKYVH